MKVIKHICDICKKNETEKRMKVRGTKGLELDYCDECKKQIPSDIVEYVKFVYRHVCGITDMTDEMAKKMLKKQY